MNTLDRQMKCVKCGFRPTFTSNWKLEFKNDCTHYGYNNCDWDATDTKEHLHQTCPDCGYRINVSCEDSETVKANTWSTTSPDAVKSSNGYGVMNSETKALVEANKKLAGTPVNSTVGTLVNRFNAKPVKPAKCCSCPVDAVEA